MQRRVNNLLAAVIAVVLAFMMLTRPAIVWVCQGSRCGTTIGYCCCELHQHCFDGCSRCESRPSGKAGKTGGVVLTAAACDCQKFACAINIRADSPARATVHAGPSAAALPVTPPAVPVGSVLSRWTAATVDARGPPLPPPRLASSPSSLRAPPRLDAIYVV